MSEILLDSKNFYHNLTLISQHITSSSKLGLVLKDNAYGHGIIEIASLAKHFGITDVFVKNHFEAKLIQPLFKNITILYGVPQEPLALNMAMAVNNKAVLSALKPKDKVELKVNIGMNRNGIAPSELEDYIKDIVHRDLELFGVFSHNGYGDDEGEDFERGRENFWNLKQQVAQICNNLGIALPRFHSLSSSGALRSQNIDDDIVRIGIAAYGYIECDVELKIAKELKRVASLWADRISSKLLPKGAKIGYGGKSILEQESVVSTYDIGYGDGLYRINEHKSLTTACGLKILPRTSMDCFSCVSDKDRICVFDDASKVAKEFDTISYEVLTRLSPFIARRII